MSWFCSYPIQVELKKISFEHLKSRDFDPSSWAPPVIFHMTSTSKLGAVSVKSSLLNKSFSEKNHCRFVTETFKVGITYPQGFYDQRNFYFINMISQPLTLSPPLSSRLRSYKKSWGALNYWGQNLLISSVRMKFFLLTTPNTQQLMFWLYFGGDHFW